MISHSWTLTPKDAIALQHHLRSELRFDLDGYIPKTVAGIDVSVSPGRDELTAVIVVFDATTMQEIEIADVVQTSTFPYIPGLLSFREGPPIMAAYQKLTQKPDLIVVDGQGIAHPRGFGLASHLGLLMDVPAIGCAKTCLVGHYRHPGTSAGCSEPLIYKDQEVGRVVRTRTNIRPVFVSPGYRINSMLAVQLILAYCRGRRLPEPTRLAHLRVNAIRRQSEMQLEEKGE